MIIEYARVREDAIKPTRGNPSDAGLDIYYNPEHATAIAVEPASSARLQSGLQFGIPHGYMLQVMNRSSIAAKRNLVVGAHVVDSGYDGEVFVDIHNIGQTTQIIEPGTKIAQVVLVPVVPFRPSECPSEHLYSRHPITISERGDGALGSTDETPPTVSMPSDIKLRSPLSSDDEYDDDEYDEEEYDEEDWEEEEDDE